MCVLNDFDVVYLKSILEYKPEAGSWDWFVSKGNQKAGSKAGSIRKSDGYYRIKINGKEYVSHRLAWLKKQQKNILENLRDEFLLYV